MPVLVLAVPGSAPRGVRLAGGQEPTAEHDIHGHGLADRAGQTLRPAGAGDHADVAAWIELYQV